MSELKPEGGRLYLRKPDGSFQLPIPLDTWIKDRAENCERIAKGKPIGDDRNGWLEDAAYFRAIIAALPAPATQEVDELREWKSAIITLCVALGSNAMPWGGDKTGWGFIHYFVGHLHTRAVAAEEDTARLDWLEMQSVKVPSNFWAFPPGGGTARPSDLRAQIDRARAAEKDKG